MLEVNLLQPLCGTFDLGGERLQVPLQLGVADCEPIVFDPTLRGLGFDKPQAVRQAEDLGRGRPNPSPAKGGRALSDDITVSAPSVTPAMNLQGAANPFDFWPLVERGFVEWSGTSDALLNGAPVEGALRLFRDGLRSGTLDLFLGFLGEAPQHGIQPATLMPLFEDVKADPRQIERTEVVQFSQEGSSEAVLDRLPVIFDVVSVFHGYLQGHLLWVAPEYRGQGLVGQYFDAALAVAGRHGLKGFMFLSTLPLWERRAPRYGFEARGRIRQPGGPDVIAWFREVC